MIVNRIEKCRVCGNQNLISVCDLGVMALTGVFPGKDEQFVPEGPLELVKCHGGQNQACGPVQLRHSFDPRILFGESYGYRSGLNESMRAHLQNITQDIRRFLTLKRGDVVLDIGSNDGTLLNFFSGENLVLLGVDPTARQFQRYYSGDVQVIPDLFSGMLVKKKLGTKKAKVITAIAVLYDLAKPLEFLAEVQEILSNDGICVLEQSYLPLVLDNNAYDTVCHEHVSYYRLKQIKWLANRVGLKIIACELNRTNGGSFRVVLAQRNTSFTEDADALEQLIGQEEQMSLDSLSPYLNFRKNIFEHRDNLSRTIGALRVENRPGTRIPIISEEEARIRRPDVFFVLPWHLKEGFLEKEKKYLQGGGMFLLPFPQIDIIKYP